LIHIQISDLFKSQADIVRILNASNYQDRQPSERPCAGLASCITPQKGGVNQDNLSPVDIVGYKNLLDMMSEMLGEGENSPQPPG
jgi:hypothetical protein